MFLVALIVSVLNRVCFGSLKVGFGSLKAFLVALK